MAPIMRAHTRKIVLSQTSGDIFASPWGSLSAPRPWWKKIPPVSQANTCMRSAIVVYHCSDDVHFQSDARPCSAFVHSHFIVWYAATTPNCRYSTINAHFRPLRVQQSVLFREMEMSQMKTIYAKSWTWQQGVKYIDTSMFTFAFKFYSHEFKFIWKQAV